jgi:YD repeat-containing protein
MESINQMRTESELEPTRTAGNLAKSRASRRWIWRFYLLTVSLLVANSVWAQAPEAKRGFQAGGSYALSDIETIGTTNGNVMLRFPLGTLPTGRGGMSGNLTLFYDSKLYDITPLTEEDFSCQPTADYPKRLAHREMLGASANGGWHYSSNYRLEVKDRLEAVSYDPEQGPHYPDNEALARWKLNVIFPDGSSHPFQQRGYSQIVTADGYSSMRADGVNMIWGGACNGHSSCPDTSQITGPLFYYSTDGTYLRLVVDHDSYGATPFTLYFPDGGKVTSTTTDSSGVTHQLTYDRNGNSIDQQSLTLSNTHQATRLVDPVTGRYTQIEYNAATDEDWITQLGVGGSEVKWRIKWKNIQVVREYRTVAAWNLGSGCDIHGYPFTLKTSLRMVDQIILPSQIDGDLHYTFGYNGAAYSGGAFQTTETTGWGELSRIQLPSGATADYTYKLDGVTNVDPHEIWSGDVQVNSPTSKTLKYDLEYDSGPSDATEVWTYAMTIPNSNTDGGFSVITGPDGGVTTEYFEQF